MVPEARYAMNGDVSLAWSQVGTGPIDLLLVMGGVSHVEHFWDEPGLARYLERLAQFSRVILMDRRGVGLSDPVTAAITLDDEVADIAAVLDAAGSERTVLLTYTWGGPVGIRFARVHPERVRALILYASVATTTLATEDFGQQPPHPDTRFDDVEAQVGAWAAGIPLEQVAPSRAGDERLKAWLARLVRLSSSPGGALTLWRSTSRYDARDDLEDLRVPTLILHRAGDRAVDVRHSRDMARRIPGARFVELEGEDNLPSVGDTAALVAELEEFLTGTRRRSIERALLTVLVTDIVGSTQRAAAMGDAAWRDLLAAHDAAVRREIERFDGREVKDLGDGFLIAFAGAPSHAHRCALAIVESMLPLGLELRAGVHTGECELIGDDVGGMAVHVATRVAALAGPNEVMASGTAYGTVVGSGLRFDHYGSHELKGVPGKWPIMRLVG